MCIDIKPIIIIFMDVSLKKWEELRVNEDSQIEPRQRFLRKVFLVHYCTVDQVQSR